MPHFDQFGGDTWICQVCAKVKNSRQESHWRTDITGSESGGNVCDNCLSAHARTGFTGDELRNHVKER